MIVSSDIKQKPKSKAAEDEVLVLIDQLEDAVFQKTTGILSYPYEDFIKMGPEQVNDFLTGNRLEELDAFNSFFKQQKEESLIVAAELKKFYTGRDYLMELTANGTETVKTIVNRLHALTIRAKRLLLISQPDYVVTSGQNKKYNRTYHMAKGYWISDQGKRERIFNKNIGLTGFEIEDTVEKLFESMGYNTTQPQSRLSNGAAVDLIVDKGGNKRIVEVKYRDKKSFWDIYMSMEMWKLYNSIYFSQTE